MSPAVCNTLTLAEALAFAIEKRARVINLSLTGPTIRCSRGSWAGRWNKASSCWGGSAASRAAGLSGERRGSHRCSRRGSESSPGTLRPTANGTTDDVRRSGAGPRSAHAGTRWELRLRVGRFNLRGHGEWCRGAAAGARRPLAGRRSSRALERTGLRMPISRGDGSMRATRSLPSSMRKTARPTSARPGSGVAK